MCYCSQLYGVQQEFDWFENQSVEFCLLHFIFLLELNGHFLEVKIVVQKLDTISISILKLYTYFWREKM